MVTPRTSLASARLNRAQPGNQGVKLTKSKMKERCRYVPSRAELVSCVVTGRVSSTAHHAPAFRFTGGPRALYVISIIDIVPSWLFRRRLDRRPPGPGSRDRRADRRAPQSSEVRDCVVCGVSVCRPRSARPRMARMCVTRKVRAGQRPCEVSATYGTCVSEVEK